MSKKYRVKFPIPMMDDNVIKPVSALAYGWRSKDGSVHLEWSKEVVESNPEFFELINERIKVEKVEYAVTFYGHVIEVYTDKPTPKEKFPLIKQVIEAIINDDVLLGVYETKTPITRNKSE